MVGPRTKQTARKSTGGRAPSGLGGTWSESGDESDEALRKYISDYEASDTDEEMDESMDHRDEAEQGIRTSLQRLFKSDHSFSGSFSFHQAFPEAPNPCLMITGLGTVGLPLATHDAEAIKTHAEQAPFGKSHQTLVDKLVRDTWEVDAKKVKVENRAWKTFMDRVVRDVCQTLGVNYDASQPRCDLYKLLLYEKGSHFLPHVDTEKVNGMFATIVVVLPSKFKGGAVHVSHGDSSKVYDCSANSLTDTTVLAWYTDVQHEVKRITSGYRLALSYNLVHTTSLLRPTLPSQNLLASRLQDVLTAWKNGEADAPTKIIYLLNHKYSQANLTGSALKGPDAHLVAILDDVARPLGFHLGLANLVCTERGAGYEYDTDGGVEWEGVIETYVVIKNLVDLAGKRLARYVEFDPRTDMIPDKLAREIVAGGYDEKIDHEGYMGNEGATIDRVYLRTVLVIWPSRANLEILHGEEALTVALDKLDKSTTTKPSAEEQDLVQFVLDRARKQDRADAITILCRLACQWKDVDLWTRSFKKCGIDADIGKVAADGKVDAAVAAFGFAAIRPFLETAIDNDTSSVRTLRFLDRFETYVAQEKSESFRRAMRDWADAQWAFCFSNLRPLEGGGSDDVIALAVKYGGVELLEETLIPQVTSDGPTQDLPQYAMSIGKNGDIPTDTRSRLAKHIMNTAVSKVDFYCFNSYDLSVTSLDVATAYVTAVCNLGFDDLLPSILSKLVHPTREVSSETKMNVLLPILEQLGEVACIRPRDQALPDCSILCKEAVQSFSDVYLSDARAATTPSARDILPLIKGLVAMGQTELLLFNVISAMGRLNLDATTLRTVIDQLHSQRKQCIVENTLDMVIEKLVKKYASVVDLVPTTSQKSTQAARVQPVLDVLEYCFEMKASEACADVLNHFFDPRRLDATFFEHYIVPLLRNLSPFLKKHQQQVSSPAFAPAFRNLLIDWADRLVGPKPPESSVAHMLALGTWACDCADCSQVRHFLLSNPDEAKSWHALGAPRRKHLEKFLRNHAASVATWQTLETRPQGLLVRKKDIITAPVRWAVNRAAGQKLLSAVSRDHTELRTILGTDYGRVLNLLGVQGSASNVSAAPQQSIRATSAVTSEFVAGPEEEPKTKQKKRPDGETREGSETLPKKRKKVVRNG